MRGFDDYVNMVLDDVTEYELDGDGTKRKVQLDQVKMLWCSSVRSQVRAHHVVHVTSECLVGDGNNYPIL